MTPSTQCLKKKVNTLKGEKCFSPIERGRLFLVPNYLTITRKILLATPGVLTFFFWAKVECPTRW